LHEKLGIQEQQVEIKAGASHNVDFVFARIAEGKR